MTQIDYPSDRKASLAIVSALKAHQHPDHLLILAIPPGGVAVAAELANSLIDDVEVSIVRNLGVFFHHENTTPPHDITGRVVIVIPNTQIQHDRLLSTIQALERLGPEEVVIAQPTLPAIEPIQLASS